ncbi:hypothetical protein HanXRQr2_Chr05g0198311 [Helianthus annuus]|uniref:Uncharacterized protein n=1 Tax=Helianthus annuus TaxID=4232 RepID=A0A9K3NL29_HELAN|nr:hypothetical protein HanXRQr2_Chr05g0198311 [Helianthus annuus]KAJ0959146.1 hypothetical protein HanPSC8_Chr00c448g0808391 [Helianthus annuus]
MAARRSPSLGRAIRRLFDTKAHSLIPFRSLAVCIGTCCLE